MGGLTCTVQGVNVLFPGGGLLLDAVSDLEFSGLVVRAVGDGNEFLVLATTSDREPGFEVALHGRCVICIVLAPRSTLETGLTYSMLPTL